MADFQFDHPHYLARREQSFQGVAATGGINGFWRPAFACRLTAIKVTVITAGTAAANYVFNQGTATTVIGTIATSIGTAAMFTVGTLLPSALDLAAGTPVWGVKGSEATGVHAISYEYVPTPFGSVTA